MGACASLPKTIRGEEGAAPLPQPQKEETTTTTTTEAAAAVIETTNKEVNVVEEDKKVDGEGKKEEAKVAEEKSEDKVVDENNSLGSLLNEEAPNESAKEGKAKGEELPVSGAEPEKTSTPAPEKKTEVAEKK